MMVLDEKAASVCVVLLSPASEPLSAGRGEISRGVVCPLCQRRGLHQLPVQRAFFVLMTGAPA
ncbi:MAG: hypothetical protein GPOALKHO_001508 [Sodalis sp.]|nr:MAG: hypothetical protein GPOALKHO_001508 [Sodalis sp.]